MKKILYILLPIIAIIFTGCDEDVFSILFSTENISNPDNVTIEYYSPDPSCLPYRYEITANSNQSEISLKCTNFSQIALDKCDSEEGSDWTASLIDSNTIVISFDEIETDNDQETSVKIGYIEVSAIGKKGKVTTDIHIVRVVQYNAPLL